MVKNQVLLEGALAWRGKLGLGLPWQGARFGARRLPAHIFSLHFRSPMSLPSTSTPPTPSAQVSFKPTCMCPGSTPGCLPGQREGQA